MRGCVTAKGTFYLLLFLIANLFAQNPGPRYGHTMVSYNGKIYLFGGGGSSTTLGKTNGQKKVCEVLNDLWAYNIDQGEWGTIIPSNKPPVRKGHSAVVWNGKMVVYGGENGTETFNDLWTFDFTSKEWTQLTISGNPPAVSNHSACIDGDNLVIAGGCDSSGVSLNTVEILDLNNPQQGFQNKANLTEPLQSGGMFMYNSSYYFVGGIWDDWDASSPGSQPSYSSNIWQLGTSSSSWNHSPFTGDVSEISKFAGVYDSENNKYYAIGGEKYDYTLNIPITVNTIKIIDPFNRTVEVDSIPVAYYCQTAALSMDSGSSGKINFHKVTSANEEITNLYIYGGLNTSDEVLSNFYKYNPATKTLTEIELPTAPTTPTNLTAITQSSSQIDLSWTDNSSDETGFKIEEKIGHSGTWVAKDSVVANVVLYQSTNLASNTQYYYRVSAYNTVGESTSSNEAEATTLNVAPKAPTNLITTVVSSTQISLSWTDNSDNEDGFVVQRKTGINGTWASIDSSSAATYEDTGLSPNTEYYYRVSAYNAIEESSFSNEVNATTLDITPTIPVAPTNLTATAQSSSQINLSWTDNSNNEVNFVIERKTNQSIFTELATVNANVITYSDNDLVDGINYTYRIFATSLTDTSDYSNETSSTTQLNSPTEILASNSGANFILLSWKDNSQSETGFKIERKSLTMFYFQIAEVTDNTTSYVDTNFSGVGEFCYRVMAFNDIVNSEYSDEAWISITDVSGENVLPKEFVLHQNYPNPFNPSTTIRYEIPTAGFVTLKVYDLLGREYTTLVSEKKSPGYHEIKLDGSKLSTGIYFYELRCGQFSQIKKLIMLK